MNICIYGASGQEIETVYFEEVEALGRMLGKEKHTLIFGGGATGLMGAAARGFKKEGAKIIGISPSFFHIPGVLYEECDELILTKTMGERKQKMDEMSDVFLAVPGGIGTLDEFFEMITLRQVGQCDKPVILYNCNGFYDGLLQFMNQMAEGKFMAPFHEQPLFWVCNTPEEVTEKLKLFTKEK